MATLNPTHSLTHWFVGSDNLTGSLHILKLQLSPPPLSSLVANKVQNGDVLVPADPGPHGIMAVKMESEKEFCMCCIPGLRLQDLQT